MELIRTTTGLVGLEKTTVYLAFPGGTYQESPGYVTTIDGITVVLHRKKGGSWHTTDPGTGLALPWYGKSRKAALDQLTPGSLDAVRRALNSERARSPRLQLAEYLNTPAE